MKIIQIIEYFQPKLGYEEYFISKNFIKKGHKVTVITSDRYFPFPNYETTYLKVLGSRLSPKVGFKIEENVPTLRLPVIIEFGTSLLLKGLYTSISKINPNIIHLHGLYHPLTFQCLFIVKRFFPSLKIIVDEHTLHMFEERSPIKRFYLEKIHKYLFLFYRRNIHQIYVTKEIVQTHVKEHFNLNVPIIPLGVDTTIFDASRYPKHKIRTDFGFTNYFVLFYSGKIMPKKGIKELLILFKDLNKDYEVGLVLIGSGSNEYILQIKNYVRSHKLDEKFRLIPFLQHKQLPEYMASADLGCWIGEISSASISEMLGTGRPVLVKNFEGSDLEKLGYSFAKKYRSKSSAINWITILNQNKEINKQVCEGARKFAIQNLDWKITSEKILKLYYS